MKCLRCEADNRDGARFCRECGAALAVRCSACGAQVEAASKFCDSCGAPLTAASAPAQAAPPRFASPQSYTPQHLAERILISKAALEGERKQVTVLFADLKGSMELLADRDPEEARNVLDPILEHMMEAVHRYEGTVNQVMGDGIMAIFGAPLAHEDHAVRACYAALRMQQTIKRYAAGVFRSHGVPVQVRIGLNSGEVVVRSIGSDLHMDYTAVGQTTHLAARMEQMATPGTVLMAPATLQLAEGYVEVSSRGPVPVKGLAEPIAVYELTAASATRSRLQAVLARGLTRFVGRDPELEQLRRALALAGDGHGRVVAVGGEPGVGKSRLFHEFVHSHRTEGWLVLQASSVSYGKATSYLPVIDLLRTYFKITEHDTHREMRAKVTGGIFALDRALEPMLSPIFALLDVPTDDPEWSALEPQQRRRRTLDAAKRLLLRESQAQPLLLVFEDLHWIDSETQALLDGLVDSVPAARVLLLVNYRPEYSHGWGARTYYSQLRLDPLPPETTGALLDALLGRDPSVEPLRALLTVRAGGNPLFLEESVRSLAEAKSLTGDRGAYRLTRPLEAVEVPATVQAILAARIDRLAPEDKALLQCAAVIGKDVPFVLLRAIAGEPDDLLNTGLAHLQTAEFLYETSLFPDPEYTFKHALLLEVVYQGLLRERRRVLHERVLEALVQQWAGRELEKIELFAYHAVRGQMWDRAARYLYQSGEKALAQARYAASAASYRAAVEALDQLGNAADLSLKLDASLELWSARMRLAQFDGVRELAESAEALARALDDGPRLAQVQVRQAQGVCVHGTIPGTLQSAIEKAHEAFERAGPGDLRTRSYAQYIVGCACRDLGRIVEAVREFGAGLALFEQVARYGEEPGLVFPIYVSLGAWGAEAHASLGDFHRAFASARDALRVATDIQHPSSLSVANDYLGYVHLLHGELDAAVPLLERALAIATEQDLFQGTVRASAHLACVLVLLGERDRGLGCLARAFDRWTGTMTRQVLGDRTMIASAYVAAGLLEEARAEIRRALAEATERNARGFLAPLLRLEAEVLASDPAAARERLETALALAADLGMHPEVAHCHAGLAQLHRRMGKRQQAQEHLTAATAMYREMGMTYWLEKAEAEYRTGCRTTARWRSQ